MRHVSWKVIDQWQADNKDFQLIDVRELSEHQQKNKGGILLPLDEIMKHQDKIAHDKPVVMYCKRGIRSQIAIQRLEQRLPNVDFYNLQGGIEAIDQ